MRAPATSDQVVLAPSDRRRAVLDTIGSARRRLLLSVFRCDDRYVIEALAAARRRNVQIEVLLTRHAKDSKTSLRLLRLLLEQIGVCVWRYADPLTKYHCKYIVADDSLALIGSLNFTRKCFRKTSDFLVVTEDPAVAQDLVALFEADCGTRVARPPTSLSERLIVAPGDARKRITELLLQARHSIRIIDPKLTDEATIDLLKARASAGVAVQVVGDSRVAGLISHGRLVLLDGQAAIIGSMALSSVHLDTRREVGIIVHDPVAVAHLTAFFESALAVGAFRPVLNAAHTVVA